MLIDSIRTADASSYIADSPHDLPLEAGELRERSRGIFVIICFVPKRKDFGLIQSDLVLPALPVVLVE